MGLDLRDGELQVVAECLRLCSRRGGSRGVAAVVLRSNKGQLQEKRFYLVSLSRAREDEAGEGFCVEVQIYR